MRTFEIGGHQFIETRFGGVHNVAPFSGCNTCVIDKEVQPFRKDFARMRDQRGTIFRAGNIAAKDQEGNTPLHLAADLFTIDMLKVFVDMGAMVNARNQESWTPLHLAANRGKREVVEFLLGVGADINAVASNGWTPLKVAVNCGHLQLSEFIRSQGGHQ